MGVTPRPPTTALAGLCALATLAGCTVPAAPSAGTPLPDAGTQPPAAASTTPMNTPDPDATPT